MKTLILGDSFSNGCELNKTDNIWWKQIDPTATCLAANGDANGTMLYKFLRNQDYDRVIVMWTFSVRFDFSPWCVLQIHSDDPATTNFKKLWYSNVGGDAEYVKDHCWRNIYTLQSLLKDANIDYIFCFSDFDIFRNGNNTYNKDNILYPIDWHNFFQIDELNGFDQWARKNSYSIGPGGHPLDDANIEYGKQVKDWYETRNTTC